MKKTLLSIAAFTSLAFGATDAQIADFFSKILPPDASFNIISKKDVGNGFEQVTFEIKGQMDGKEVSQKDIIFTNGDFFAPDIISLKDGSSLKDQAQKALSSQSLLPLLKAEKKEYIISVGNDPKKPTEYMFTDPECPYCRAELARIEQELKDKNLKMVLTPVHDRSALEKAALIYKEVAKAKSDSEKVKIMRKYYAPSAKVEKGSVSDAEVARLEELRSKYFQAGLKSVPYKIMAE
ncbi:histidine kinase [Campylobacter sp. 19-13652]|uniref:histidine kinase n=1 Tax=Campylobacter sp. 19-13652 TaxID=2840180 RepID=UPI001C770F02|nr:histidine kinase [Campylobacter sp. 19-13652]BCX78889.1 hypothetical protein LBC_03510 [Campylobacter sp. 19-13652]